MQSKPLPADSKTVVRLDGVHCTRGGRVILDTGTWELPATRHGLITGPSGSGKTTLLHLIAGLEHPDRGNITVLGQSLGPLGPRERDRFRARNIGLVFQDFHLLDGLTVIDNLRLPLWLAGRRPERQRACALLERLELTHLGHSDPHRLSQGEKQRVAIARAVINHPRLIIADEPTSALDDANAARVLDLLLAEAATQDASLLVASHDRRIQGRFDTVLTLETPV